MAVRLQAELNKQTLCGGSTTDCATSREGNEESNYCGMFVPGQGWKALRLSLNHQLREKKKRRMLSYNFKGITYQRTRKDVSKTKTPRKHYLSVNPEVWFEWPVEKRLEYTRKFNELTIEDVAKKKVISLDKQHGKEDT